MSRDDFGDVGAALWPVGDPGAVTVGYIPERPKFGFKTAPERDHSWRDLVIVQGVITDSDPGDESDDAGDSENAR